MIDGVVRWQRSAFNSASVGQGRGVVYYDVIEWFACDFTVIYAFGGISKIQVCPSCPFVDHIEGDVVKCL